MAEKPIHAAYQEVLDPHPTGQKAVEVVETILPYFPDNPLKRLYLAYISCGYTRKEAIRRCRNRADFYEIDQDSVNLEEWRNSDPDFCYLDDLGYGKLHEQVANAYMEMMVRRDTVAVLELNETILHKIQQKIDLGIELTKDERFIYNKAANIYTPENIQKMVKLVKGDNSPDEGHSGTVIDFVAMIKGQVRT